MKVARWKVVGLAGALALGYVADAFSAQIKVDDKTWANFGLDMKIWYKNLDKRSNATDKDGWTQNKFEVGNAKIYFTGQVTPVFQFYGEFDQEKPDNVGEAGINLAFAKEFQVLAGKIRKPFTRAQLSSGYALLTPQGYWLDPQGSLGAIRAALGSTDHGLMIHGDLAGGMFRYRVGVYNENRELGNKLWVGIYNSTHTIGWFGVGRQRVLHIDSSNFIEFDYRQTPGTKANNFKNFEWNARIEFTPTMLGFKPESAATITAKIGDTYLGARDVFTIGLGYHAETHTPKATVVVSGRELGTPFSERLHLGDLKRKGWTVDAMFEKKYGNVVPNLQTGYISLDKTHYYYDYKKDAFKKGDSDIWYVTGQLLFDQVAWLGKPAIAFRYEKIKGDGQYYYYVPATDTEILKKDLTAETFGLAFNYYIKGQAARISVGFDQTKYKDALKYFLKTPSGGVKREDSITDWYLYFQSRF
ncbi:MAG: hypothetical protein LM575_05685 [Caldimicrobium sp.]|nr:hypothetical protein [Caldimicrobium sp.]